MHSRVNFEIFNSTDGNSISFDENYTMNNETDGSTFDSFTNTTSTESIDNYSTYLLEQNFNMFDSGDTDSHVVRNEGQHYHPDDHEYQKYLRLNVYDSPENSFFDLSYDDLFKHEDSTKYSIFVKDHSQFNEGT